MINLLPPALKNAYRYGLRNVKLIHWVVALSLGLIGLVVICTASLIYMQEAANSYDKPIQEAKATLQKENLTSTQAEVKDISGNLRLAVKVLSQEVLFSKLIVRLGQVTPSNTVLTGLTILQTQPGISLTARATDYTAATQVQVNIIDPANKIFQSADIQSIVCTDNSTAQPGSIEFQYPCLVTIRALFDANTPFLFINDKGQ